MGVVLMSKRELNRIDVLARLDGRRLTTLAAADLMRVTPCRGYRFKARLYHPELKFSVHTTFRPGWPKPQVSHSRLDRRARIRIQNGSPT
jgi:hypothetical protein